MMMTNALVVVVPATLLSRIEHRHQQQEEQCNLFIRGNPFARSSMLVEKIEHDSAQINRPLVVVRRSLSAIAFRSSFEQEDV